MRAVIDTNVWVSSFFGGLPRKVIDVWAEGLMTLCLSEPIVAEYVEVLQRLKVDEAKVEQLLSLWARGTNCLYAARTPELCVVQSDPDDNKFIECAVALNARYIVSGDADLLSIGKYFDVAIVSPRQFLGLVT